MEEKKLTDEEIVKALDICYNSTYCTNECPYFNKNGRNFCMEDKAFYKGLKDLINRLQSENKELRTESDRMVAEHLAFVERAKKADEQQKKYIEYLKRKLDQANVTYRSRL